MRRGPILALGLLAGAGVGEAAWRGLVQARSSSAPPGFEMEEDAVPFRLAGLAGDLPHRPEAWSLDYWRAIRPLANERVAAQGLHISGLATIPEGGQLEIWPSLEPGRSPAYGVGLVLERIEPAGARVIQVTEGRQGTIPCDGVLPPPGVSPVEFEIEARGDHLQIRVGDAEVACTALLGTAAPALRPGLRRVQFEDLVIGDQQIPAPGPGLRPLWWVAGGIAGLLLVAFELGTGAHAALIGLSTLPLLLAWILAPRELRSWVEELRAPWLPIPWLALWIPVSLSLSLKGLHHLGRLLREPEASTPDWSRTGITAALLPTVLAMLGASWAVPVVPWAVGTLVLAAGLPWILPAVLRALGARRPGRAGALITATGSVLALGLVLTSPLHPVALIDVWALGATLALVLWANVNAARVRWVNLLSLASVVALFAAAEGTLRLTSAGQSWAGLGTGGRTTQDSAYGWVQTATRDLALFEEARHTTYPDKGYPIAIPDREAPVRLVAMGGSTTGGAFQNDNLNDFYPARLQALAGRELQVVNQGVGGWTTWQISRYLLDHLSELEPDVLTLYVGHNDLLTPMPLTYAQLQARRTSSPTAQRAGALLGGLGLFQGLRFLVASLRGEDQQVAVPISDARETLERVIAAMRGRDGWTLLMSEGLTPDPTPLAPYYQMLAELARGQKNVRYLDMAAILNVAETQGRPIFLDDCHLTGEGHTLVARTILQELQQEKILAPSTAPQGAIIGPQ